MTESQANILISIAVGAIIVALAAVLACFVQAKLRLKKDAMSGKPKGTRETGSADDSSKDPIREKIFALLRSTCRQTNPFEQVTFGDGPVGWPKESYWDAVTAIRRTYPKVSEQTIDRYLFDLLAKLLEQAKITSASDPDALDERLRSILKTVGSQAVLDEIATLRSRLEAEIKAWSVFVFVEGIVLTDLTELQLGSFTLYPKDAGPLPRLLKELTPRAPDVHQEMKTWADHCHCYLTFDVEGESRFVDQEIGRLADGGVAILNLYCAWSTDRESLFHSIVVLGHQTITHNRLILKQAPPINAGSLQHEFSYWEQGGPARHHDIDKTKVEHWKEHGLDAVLRSVTLTDPTPGTAESRIQKAAMWYSRAMNAPSKEEQFVDLTTALESLLVGEEEVSKGQRLADGVSGLLPGDFKKREKARKRMKELYDVRSKAVHQGITVAGEDLRDLDRIAANTILEFACRESISSSPT